MPAGSTIFVGYRHGDTEWAAGRLGDRLTERFGKVFMDIDTDPGVDFTAAIRRAVGECDIMLALIGDKWTSVVDRHGRRRLDDPDDWIVQEIRSALDRDIRVIPVLVDPARMPTRTELPEVLTPLVNRQAVTLRHATFRADVEMLVAAIERAIEGPERPHDAPGPKNWRNADARSANPTANPDFEPAVEADVGQRENRTVTISQGYRGTVGRLTHVKPSVASLGPTGRDRDTRRLSRRDGQLDSIR